jgi:hypothetical protein
MMGHDQLVDLVPVYALDALEGPELADLERHLAGCDECQAVLADHLEVAASLVPDEAAPHHVWDRIVAEIGTGTMPAPPIDLNQRRETRRSSGLAWAAAAVAAIAAVVLGALALFQSTGDADLLAAGTVADAAERAADQPGAIVNDFLVDGEPVAELVLTSDGQGFFVPTDALEVLSADRTYQLWVVNTGADVISAGVLGSDPVAAAFTWTGDVAGFALTREVAGGVVSSEGDVVSVIEDV